MMKKLTTPARKMMSFASGGLRTVAAYVLAAVLFSSPRGLAATPRGAFQLPKEVPAPINNPVTPARVELGKMLFFDPRLSGSNWISCATCHNPALNWADGLPRAVGHGMKTLGRGTPSIVDAAFNDLQMWDGRFTSLEQQALGPIQGPTEMNGSINLIIANLDQLPGYRLAFEEAYPGEAISATKIAMAIASFERTVISRDSPFRSMGRRRPEGAQLFGETRVRLIRGKGQLRRMPSASQLHRSGFP
jgi:cytochrome c peroxidase